MSVSIKPIIFKKMRYFHRVMTNLSTCVGQIRFKSCQLGHLGTGSGKGGAGGGSIRQAGGAFGKAEAAREEEYFYKQRKEQLRKLKANLPDELNLYEEEIKRHQDAISHNKKEAKDFGQL